MTLQTITIGGVAVEIDRPCDVLRELRKAHILVAAGESVAMTRFEDDQTQWATGNIAGLERLIATYENLCDRENGKRRRFAARVRFT